LHGNEDFGGALETVKTVAETQRPAATPQAEAWGE
jgi:hypothetical protein